MVQEEPTNHLSKKGLILRAMRGIWLHIGVTTATCAQYRLPPPKRSLTQSWGEKVKFEPHNKISLRICLNSVEVLKIMVLAS